MQWLLCFEWNQIFTDAGQYVIRFGSADPSSKTGPASVVKHSTEIEVSSFLILLLLMFFFFFNPGQIQELEVTRPLTLSERAVAVALAISLDNDYFSRHGGW